MNRDRQRFLFKVIIAVATGLLSAAMGPAFAADGGTPAGGGMPRDWSDRHVLYPNPDTRDQAAGKGTVAFAQWKKKLEDPRFALQVARKTRFVEASAQRPFSDQQLRWAARFRRNPPPAGPEIHRDWSAPLGGISGVGMAGVFPAKFQFDINATASCANDFVVYATASSGAASGSLVAASQTGTFTSGTPSASTVTITNGSNVLTLTGSSTLNTGLNFQVTSTPATNATNLAAAIARNGATVGVTASSVAAVVTVTATTAGNAGNRIALAEGLSRFSWAGTTLAGGAGSGQPTIVAFNNLYSSCGATVPSTLWSFNTGDAAFTETSPVLSLDGAQVAFVQRTGSAASLVLLKWSASSGTLDVPNSLTGVGAGSYRACAAPCMTVIAFSGSPNDTNSSPFYDYTNDILYVGADNGTLHKFTGVFNGTPAEAGSPWPVAVSANTNLLSSPVFDSVSGLVYVGSTSGTAAIGGGQLHSVDAASGALVSSARLARNSSSGVRDAPIVDSNAQMVYAFVGSQLGTATSASCSSAPCAAVFQFPTAFAAAAAGTYVQVGKGVVNTTQRFLYAGAFDDAYYASGAPTSPSGNLYVCGSLAATASRPTLWQIPITANAMGTPIVGPSLVSANANCSPITEILNGANDYLFMSVTAGGNNTGCTGACVYMYNLNGLTWDTLAVAGAGLAAAGGTSGIIVDNISSATGASQIYYSTLTNPGNAIQASQAALN